MDSFPKGRDPSRESQMIDRSDDREDEKVLSRRSFLLGGGALVASAATVDWMGRYSTFAQFLDDKLIGQYDYDTVVKEAKEYMKGKYGINLVVGPEKGQDDILGDSETLESYKTSLRIIVEEMNKYPPDMLRKLGAEKGVEIRIIHDPTVKAYSHGASSMDRMAIGGYAPFLKQGKAVPIILAGENHESFQRQTLHHELNHQFAARWQQWSDRQQKWLSFHAAVSANPYRPEPVIPRAKEVSPERYFLTLHASSSSLEDQAVCAEWMMVPSKIVEFLDHWRNEKDQRVKDILAAKWNETKRNYFDWSGGVINDTFWDENIKQGEKERTAHASGRGH